MMAGFEEFTEEKQEQRTDRHRVAGSGPGLCFGLRWQQWSTDSAPPEGRATVRQGRGQDVAQITGQKKGDLCRQGTSGRWELTEQASSWAFCLKALGTTGGV